MRPTPMRTLSSTAASVTVLVGLAGLAACGEEPFRTQPVRPAQWGECTNAAFDELDGEIAEFEDASGNPVTVKLGPATGPCAGGLVARFGWGVGGLDVADLGLEPGSAEVVTLDGAGDGQPGQLLRIDGGSHPRGGFQPHLFTVENGLAEVLRDDNPLVPFVATDGGSAPTTAACGEKGTIELLEASTSEPPGVVMAWDVQRTTYTVAEDGTAEEVGSKQVRDHAADPLLRKEMPELFEPGALFAGCSEPA